MKKAILLTTMFIISIVMTISAQTTYTFTANTTDWYGETTHPNLSVTGSGLPNTFVIPTGITVTTNYSLSTPTVNFSDETIMDVQGTWTGSAGLVSTSPLTINNTGTTTLYTDYRNGSLADLTINSSGSLIITARRTAFGVANLSVANLALNITGGISSVQAVGASGDASYNVSGGTLNAGNNGITGNLTATASGTGTLSMGDRVTGTATLTADGGTMNVSSSTFSGDTTIDVRNGGTMNVSGATAFNGANTSITIGEGTFDAYESTTFENALTMNVNGPGSGKIRGSAVVNGLASLNVSGGELELGENAQFNNDVNLEATGGLTKFTGSVKFNQALTANIGNDSGTTAALEIEGGDIRVAGLASMNVKSTGTMDIKSGDFTLENAASTVAIASGGKVRTLATGVRFLIGTKVVMQEVEQIDGAFTIDNTLPIELVAFTGVYRGAESSVYLNWITASELNVDYYELLRSTDGVNYESIYRLDINEDSNEYRSYDFTDKKLPSASIVYYKLKNTDNDATFQESDVIKVVLGKAATLQISAFPNPTMNKINLSTSIESAQFEIFNKAGMLVKQGMIQEGFGSLDVTDLPGGVYFIRISHEGGFESTRFIKSE